MIEMLGEKVDLGWEEYIFNIKSGSKQADIGSYAAIDQFMCLI